MKSEKIDFNSVNITEIFYAIKTKPKTGLECILTHYPTYYLFNPFSGSAFNRLLAIILWTILPFSIAHADSSTDKSVYQSTESLEKQVYDFVKQKVDQHLRNPKIDISPISSRLQLGVCKQAVNLEDKTPDKVAGRMSFRLSCDDPDWTLYVIATVDGEVPVIISTRGILRGATIKSSDIQLAYVPYRQAKRNSMTHLKNVTGMRAKQGIGPNNIITVKMLQPPYLVFKNQPIKIVTYAGSVRVETEGIALESGTNRQQIPVRNANSKKELKGIVIAPNTVLVP